MIAYHSFAEAAERQAKLLGVPSMKFAVVEYPKPTDPEELNRKKLQYLFEKSVEGLVAAPPKKVPAPQ